MEKVCTMRGKQTTCHDGRLEWLRRVSPRQGLGPLAQRPREAQDPETGVALVTEVIEFDAVDAGHDNMLPILADAREQRLEPTRGSLDVAVQEDDDLARGSPRALHPCQHQAPALAELHEAHLGQLLDVLNERFVEAIPAFLRKPRRVRDAGIVNQDDLHEKVRRRVVQHRVHASQQHRGDLIMKDHDDACRGQRTIGAVPSVQYIASRRSPVWSIAVQR
mmetsp:Transcript_139264/g.445165  ORF Transcript_139264/g.445165 Transcript_139264/m.445165 type:complete len:220 (+) Transcript_139264:956-1615(+)